MEDFVQLNLKEYNRLKMIEEAVDKNGAFYEITILNHYGNRLLKYVVVDKDEVIETMSLKIKELQEKLNKSAVYMDHRKNKRFFWQ